MAHGKSERAKILLKEVEAYRAHCLFVESKKRAEELVRFVRQNDQSRSRTRVLRSLRTKILQIEEEAEAFEAVGLSTRLSAADKARIRRIFSSACEEGSPAAAFEAGNAFLVFGQHKEALAEFRKAIRSKRLRVQAAKNIFRCYIGRGALKRAVALYRKLHAAKSFPPAELEGVRHFLYSVLKIKGIPYRLPRPQHPVKPGPNRAGDAGPPTVEDIVIEPSLDILSAGITYRDARGRDQHASLDVNFQRKNTISLIVPGNRRALIDHLTPGTRLENIQLGTTDIIFTENGKVLARSELRVGEKRGDYAVTIKLDT